MTIERNAEYWRKRKAEQRAKKIGPEESKEPDTGTDPELPWPYNQGKPARWGPRVAQYVPLTAEEREAVERHGIDVVGGTKPKGATTEEWAYACERAARAKRYAVSYPEHVHSSERIFQDPVWQWDNEKKGRRGG